MIYVHLVGADVEKALSGGVDNEPV